MTEPVFESALSRVMEGCLSIGAQRGAEYQDTWALENQVSTFLDAVLREIGAPNFSREQKRLILLAALVDVKDSRMLGPWKRDSVEDGLNYRAVLLDLMEQYRAKSNTKS